MANAAVAASSAADARRTPAAGWFVSMSTSWHGGGSWSAIHRRVITATTPSNAAAGHRVQAIESLCARAVTPSAGGPAQSSVSRQTHCGVHSFELGTTSSTRVRTPATCAGQVQGLGLQGTLQHWTSRARALAPATAGWREQEQSTEQSDGARERRCESGAARAEQRERNGESGAAGAERRSSRALAVHRGTPAQALLQCASSPPSGGPAALARPHPQRPVATNAAEVTQVLHTGGELMAKRTLLAAVGAVLLV